MRVKLEDDLPAVVRALQDELPEVRRGRPDDPRRRHPLPEPPLKLPVVLHPPVRLCVGLEVRVLALHDPAVVHPFEVARVRQRVLRHGHLRPREGILHEPRLGLTREEGPEPRRPGPRRRVHPHHVHAPAAELLHVQVRGGVARRARQERHVLGGHAVIYGPVGVLLGEVQRPRAPQLHLRPHLDGLLGPRPRQRHPPGNLGAPRRARNDELRRRHRGLLRQQHVVHRPRLLRCHRDPQRAGARHHPRVPLVEQRVRHVPPARGAHGAEVPAQPVERPAPAEELRAGGRQDGEGQRRRRHEQVQAQPGRPGPGPPAHGGPRGGRAGGGGRGGPPCRGGGTRPAELVKKVAWGAPAPAARGGVRGVGLGGKGCPRGSNSAPAGRAEDRPSRGGGDRRDGGGGGGDRAGHLQRRPRCAAAAEPPPPARAPAPLTPAPLLAQAARRWWRPSTAPSR